MREHDIDRNLVSNIEMSDEMRESLIQDVKSGKRSKDKRFRVVKIVEKAIIK